MKSLLAAIIGGLGRSFVEAASLASAASHIQSIGRPPSRNRGVRVESSLIQAKHKCNNGRYGKPHESQGQVQRQQWQHARNKANQERRAARV